MVLRRLSINDTGHGTFIIEIPARLANVKRDNTVIASISELDLAIGEGSRDVLFIGDAEMSILNVSLREAGCILIRVHIGWKSDLDYRVSLLIADD